MGRAERRKAERKARLDYNKSTVRLKQSDINRMEKDIRDEVTGYCVDMLFTCVALAEHRLYGFGQKRCIKTLEYLDSLMTAINNDEADMKDYVQALKDETGLEIRTDGRTIE